LSGAGRAAEDFDDHPEVTVGGRYATLAPLNMPLSTRLFPSLACAATGSSKRGVATAMWWTPSPFPARKLA